MWAQAVSFHSGLCQGVKVFRFQEPHSTPLGENLYRSITCMVLFQAQGKLDSSNLNLASVSLAEPDLA